MELENARIFAGIPIDIFENLWGINEMNEGDNSYGIFESKADVLTYYRATNLVEQVIEYKRSEKYKK